jgi:hypothetical protein
MTLLAESDVESAALGWAVKHGEEIAPDVGAQRRGAPTDNNGTPLTESATPREKHRAPNEEDEPCHSTHKNTIAVPSA